MKKIVFLSSFLFVLFACDRQNKAEHYDSFNEEVIASPMMQESPVSKSKQSDQEEPQKIIKTSFLDFETASIDQTYLSISKWVYQNKGFIQNDISDKSYNRLSRKLVIRVPSASFQNIIDSVASTTKVFDRKEISLQDVTEEFVDLEARLIAKRKLEARYLQLLDKAKTVEDMLKIERQIAQIREEIEAKQGRLKYLNNRVAFSTINLNFYQIIQIEKSDSQTYVNRVWQAIKGGVHGVGEFVIGVLYVWPFVIIGIFVAYIIRKRIQRRKKQNKI